MKIRSKQLRNFAFGISVCASPSFLFAQTLDVSVDLDNDERIDARIVEIILDEEGPVATGVRTNLFVKAENREDSPVKFSLMMTMTSERYDLLSWQTTEFLSDAVVDFTIPARKNITVPVYGPAPILADMNSIYFYYTTTLYYDSDEREMEGRLSVFACASPNDYIKLMNFPFALQRVC